MNRRIALLVFGVFVVSTAGPLIRLANEAPALAIAFWRTSIASVVLLPLAIRKGRSNFAELSKKDLGLLMLSGTLLAVHFSTWVASIGLTTVAASVLLVTSQPIWVGLASIFLGERLNGRGWIGIALAILGAGLIALSGARSGRSELLGDLLALIGAVSAAGYLLIGRHLRKKVTLLTYVAPVYAMCALVLLVSAVAGHQRLTGFSRNTWLLIIALAIGPQLIGHTTFNFLLSRLEATKVAVAIMGEPIGSAIIAAWLFNEIPGILVFPGGVLLLAGIALAVTAQSRLEIVPDG